MVSLKIVQAAVALSCILSLLMMLTVRKHKMDTIHALKEKKSQVYFLYLSSGFAFFLKCILSLCFRLNSMLFTSGWIQAILKSKIHRV